MWKRIFIAALPLAALLAIPLALRPASSPAANGETTEKLVIVTPHTEPVKQEFAEAFRRHYRQKHGKDIEIEYRTVGGTSDIVRYIADRYEAEFRYARTHQSGGGDWTKEDAAAFANHRLDPAKSEIRRAFLNSDVGIGIDLFWGGGTYDHSRQAYRGFGVDAKVAERHPEYFQDSVIPAGFGGERFYDPEGRYYGVCLASFGICYNPDRVRETGTATPPTRWSDLGEPRFFGTTVVGDPTKSGSVNKCYEAILQQAMADAVARTGNEKKGLAEGWDDGLNLIKRIVANSRSVTDSAGKIPRDVSSGNAAAGMAIDTYGLSEEEWNGLLFDGKPKIRYAPPVGGTSISADPVQLLRGAPNRRAAEEFIDFLLSKEGQKLWDFRPGTPGGPERYALRRPPIRRDLYLEKYRECRSDPDYNPYQAGANFVYHPQWTSPYFGLIRTLIKCIALDVQPELTAAWRAIVRAGGPERVPRAMAAFNRLPFPYSGAREAEAELRTGENRSVLDVVAVCRRWSEEAIRNYREAEKLAKEGK